MTNAKKTSIFVLVLALIVAALLLPVQEWTLVAYQWALDNPRGGVFAFLALFVFWVILALPASVLVILSGFLFGLVKGYGLVVLGNLFGSTAAFLIGRNVARKAVEKRIGENPRLQAIDMAIQDSGLSVVVLTRLSMVLPYNLLNYAYGLTSVRLRDYVIGTTVGMLLPLLLFAFLGTTAKDLTSVLQGQVQLQGQAWVLAFVGLVTIGIAVALITTKAKRALDEVLDKQS